MNKRSGSGYHWRLFEKTGFGARETSGYTIDNLNTKELNDANSGYERVFISIRDGLEHHCESLSLDNKEDRLQCTQVIADMLRTEGLIK